MGKTKNIRNKLGQIARDHAPPDEFSRELVRKDGGAGAGNRRKRLSGPSTNPATNLLIADVVIRSASRLFRNKVEKRVARASYGDDDNAGRVLGGRTLVTSLGLYAISRLATRSVPGLMIVTGGLVAKTLYDRGKALEQRNAGFEDAPDESIGLPPGDLTDPD